MLVEPGQQNTGETPEQKEEAYWGDVASGSILPPEDFFDTQEAPSQQGE